MTPEKKFFAPTLYPRVRTHKKGEMWFIKFYVKDYEKGKLKPLKYRGYLNHIEDFEEREREAQRIIQMMENNQMPPDAKGARRLPPENPHDNFAHIAQAIAHTLEQHKREFYTEPGIIRFQNLHSKLKTLTIWLQKVRLHKLTIGRFELKHAKDFLFYLMDERGLCMKTRNSYKIDFTMIWNMMIEDGKVKENIWKDIPCEKSYVLKSFSKHTDDVQAIIEKEMPNYDIQLYIAVWMVYGCFIRVIELSRLKISAIDWEKEVIKIPDNVCLKSGGREVPIPLQLMEILKRERYQEYDEDYYIFSNEGVPGEKRIAYHYLRGKWHRFRRKFNIPEKYKLYGLKHTGNTKFSLVGINARTLQKLNGHHSLEHIQKNYTGELSTDDIMYVRKYQPALGEKVKPVVQKSDEQVDMLKLILEKLNHLEASKQ
jgi:integrase